MKTIKPQRLALLHKPYEEGGKCWLAATVAVFFPFAQPERMLPEVAMWKFVAQELGKDAILDMCMPKVRGEVLVRGKCHIPGGAKKSAAQVRFKIGPLAKTLYVFGDRYWKKRAGVATMTDPEPFAEMGISYENAFGGPGYAPNPSGKGFVADAAAAKEPIPLPNVEHPQHLVVSPGDRPAPAGFGALDFTWPQRFSKAGTYDQKWLETRFPGYAADMDWTIFNAAPEDQWLPGFFKGDEAFEIAGMHPGKPLVQGRLPGVAVRCFINQKSAQGEAFREITTHPDTLWLFPHAERGILVYRGVTEVATDDAEDILQIVVGAERMGQPKPAEHYREILRLRLDRKKGAVHALNDKPLLPPLPEGSPVPEEANEMQALVTSKGSMRQNLRRKAERELEKAKEQLRRAREQILETSRQSNAPPPDLSELDKALAQTLPPDLPPPSLEELPEFQEKMNKMAEQARAEAMAKKAEAEARLKEVCKQQNLDYEKLVTDVRKQGGGPPRPVSLDQVKAQLQLAKQMGADVSEAERRLADPELQRRLVEANQRMQEMYQKNAHMFPPAALLAPEDAARVKQEIAAAHARKKSFAGRDLTAADLSGLDLRSADFAGALLDGADFSGANLSGANLSGAVLARARFNNARLDGAKLAGANLGFADFTGTSAQRADFTKATLAGANLRGANLSHANLAQADLLGAKAAGANFSGVTAREVKLLEVDLKPDPAQAAPEPGEGIPEMDLAGTNFAGADLTKALFLQCRVEGSDFSGARLEGATFVGAKGANVKFAGARLEKLCAVKESAFPGADFSGARLDRANLRGADLTGAKFPGATMQKADLSETRLQRADLRQAQAAGMRLAKADLQHADLTGINLREGVLQKAKLGGARLRGANLCMADLLKIRTDEGTDLSRANLKRTLLKDRKEK
ncbi:MAG: DUF2169 domain-containing protein [Betaproteobacteria bacterium]|nr:DUF2169 domain-containing protein [Betaproteobacteria bacterium]